MNVLISSLKLDNPDAIKQVIAKLDQEVEQLVNDYTAANHYITASFALRGYPDYEDLLGDSVENLRNTAFSWREKIKPELMQSMEKMRSFCTTYTSYFKDMNQEINDNLAVEEYKEILFESCEEILCNLKKVIDFFNNLATSVQTFMSAIEVDKKNLNERLLPNLEKNIEQIQAKWDENFKNVKAIIAELEGLPARNSTALTVVAWRENAPELKDEKELFAKLLALIKEYIALKPKLASGQSMKSAFQTLLTPHFSLVARVRSVGESWKQCEQEVTYEKEILAQIPINIANEKAANEALAVSTTTKGKPETSEPLTTLQSVYSFLGKMNIELESLEKKLKRYGLTFLSI
jgi:hypothetical protein